MILGANSNSYSQISKTVALPAFRGYNRPTIGIPGSFPGPDVKAIPAGVTTPVISIKPDIRRLFTGNLDAKLEAFAKSVPAGAYVTLWHEGERANEHNASRDIKVMHAVARTLMKTANPALMYGQIFTSYSGTNTNRLAGWLAPGMDFYGIDAYANTETDLAEDILTPCANQITAISPGANIVVTECNTRFADSRPAFLSSCFTWAYEKKCPMFMVYFDAPDSGTEWAWNPEDTQVMNALKGMSNVVS